MDNTYKGLSTATRPQPAPTQTSRPRPPMKKRPLSQPQKASVVMEQEDELIPGRKEKKDGVVRWMVDKKHMRRKEIIPTSRDRIVLPSDVPPKALKVFKPLLPAGVTETGLLPPNLLPQDQLPIHYTNPSLPDRPTNINNLLGLLSEGSPEMKHLATEQLRWVRTRLSVTEALMVIDGAMESYGWRAGLTYLSRMGAKPEYQLELRHFNRVLEGCCSSEAEGDKLAAGLRVLDEMKGQGVVPNYQTLYIFLEACGRRGDYRVAERVLEFAKAHHIDMDHKCFEHLFDAYCNGGNINRANQLFKEAMAHDRPIKHDSLKNFLKAHIKARRAPHFISSVKGDASGNKRDLYKTAVLGFIDIGDLTEAQALLDEMAATPDCNPDRSLYQVLLEAYGKQGMVTEAIKVFRDMKTVSNLLSTTSSGVLYTLLMNICLQHNHLDSALDLWEEARRRGLAMDSKAHLAHLRVLGEMGKLSEALRSFKTIRDRNIYHYNAILLAFRKAGRLDDMFAWFRCMGELGVTPDVVSYNLLISACGGAGGWVTGLYLMEEMVCCSLTPDPSSVQALMKVCADAGESGLTARLLSRIPEPSAGAYKIALEACKQAGEWRKSKEILAHMKEKGVPVTEIQYGLAVSACARAKDPEAAALYALDLLKDMGPPGPNAVIYGAAITACGRGGYWEQALDLLKTMKSSGVKPTLIAYNNAITACARSRRWEEAITILQEMGKGGPGSDTYPDHVSFGAAIHACARSFKPDAAMMLLREMQQYGLDPNRLHYQFVLFACQLTGRWKEAWDLLMEMREKSKDRPDVAPDSQAFETVLLTCVKANQGMEVMQLQGWMERLQQRHDAKGEEPGAVVVQEG